MISFFVLIFNGILLLLGLIAKGFFFLIRRFDITNSLLLGGGLAIASYRLEIHPAIKWGVIVFLSVGSCILQHFFKPARIVFGVMSSLFAGFMAYGISNESDFINPIIPTVIAVLVTGVLNTLSWIGITARLKRD